MTDPLTAEQKIADADRLIAALTAASEELARYTESLRRETQAQEDWHDDDPTAA